MRFIRNIVIASLLAFVALAPLSEAQSYSYQAVNRFITTTGQYCNSGQVLCNVTGTGAQYHYLTWNVTGTLSACSVRVDSSADGVSWSAGGILGAQTCTSNGNALSSVVVSNYVRINVTSITPVSTASLTVNLNGYQVNPVPGTGSVTSVAMTGDNTVYNTSVTGSPITTSGTLVPSLHTHTANTVFAGPTSGGAVVPTFRALVNADLPAGAGGITASVAFTTDVTLLAADTAKVYVGGVNGNTDSVFLPVVVPAIGWYIYVTNKDIVDKIVDGNGTNIDGITFFKVGVGQSVKVFSDGTQYYSNRGTGTELQTGGGDIETQGKLNLTSNATIDLTNPSGGTILFGVNKDNVPVNAGANSVLAATTAITSTPLLTTGVTPAQYTVVATVYCKTAVAATLTLSVTYTDVSNTSQTISPTAANCAALGANSFVLVNSPIAAKESTSIAYAVAITGSPNYDARIVVYQNTTN